MTNPITLERAGVLVREALANGGFTYAVEQGKRIDPAQLAHGTCAVSLPGFECRVPLMNVSPHSPLPDLRYVERALVEYARMVETVRNYNGAHIGGWVEPVPSAPGQLVSAYLVLDITVLVAKYDAVAQCVAWNQRAYYDFEQERTIEVTVAGR